MKKIAFIIFAMINLLMMFGCDKNNNISDFSIKSINSRDISEITVPENFDWSKVTYIKSYIIDPNTKEKREVFRENLKCRSLVPASIQRLPLKPCEKFTEAEKLLAYGVQNKLTEEAGYDILLIIMAYNRFYKKNKCEPTSIGQLQEFKFFNTNNDLEKFYSILELQPEMISLFSPITKTPFTFNNKEFVKGQLYITRITDQEFLKKDGKAYEPGTSMEEYLKERDKGFDTSKMNIYYYRVYGEDMTIAEGLWDLSNVD